jgi:hypothetical protein
MQANLKLKLKPVARNANVLSQDPIHPPLFHLPHKSKSEVESKYRYPLLQKPNLAVKFELLG